MQQLPLDLLSLPEPRFENFLIGPNAEVIQNLRDWLSHQGNAKVFWLWGEAGSGKTHLLKASLAGYPTLKAFDNLEHIEKAQLHSLFIDLIEQDREQHFLVTSIVPPKQIRLREDVLSRLQTGLIYEVKPLSDDQKALALCDYAQVNGLKVSDELIAYLLRHYPRDIRALLKTAQELDRYSLMRKKLPTVPLLKEMLAVPA